MSAAERNVIAGHGPTEANPPWSVTEYERWPGETLLLVHIGHTALEFYLDQADDRIQLHYMASAVLDALTRTQPEFVAKIRADAGELAGGVR